MLKVKVQGERKKARAAEAELHRTVTEVIPQHSGTIFGAARDATSKSCTQAPLCIFIVLKLHSLISITLVVYTGARSCAFF